jgi:hypothetical protein
MKRMLKRIWCCVTLFHFDPGVRIDSAGCWRCKYCGGKVTGIQRSRLSEIKNFNPACDPNFAEENPDE